MACPVCQTPLEDHSEYYDLLICGLAAQTDEDIQTIDRHLALRERRTENG